LSPSSSSNDITIVNDNVPNWIQSGGQVSWTTAAFGIDWDFSINSVTHFIIKRERWG
jgi:hypothetical protein